MRKYECYYQTPFKHILNNLSLLGISSQQSMAECKLSLQQSPIQKLSYFIIFHSLKHLTEQYKLLTNWYPPRTLSDQIEFKKIAMQIIINLQNQKRLPRNFVIDKRSLDDSDRIVDILRYLTEFALRQSYVDLYSDLIQVSLVNENQGINKYYPQVLTRNQSIDEEIFELFETHIELLKSRLIQNSTFQPFTLPFNFEQLRTSIEYQNEIKGKLSKVPKQLFSQNRQLDRIQIIDKLNQMWRTIDIGVQHVDTGSNEFVQGQKQLMTIDQEWESWLRTLVGSLKGLTKKRQQQKIKNPKRISDLKNMLSQLEFQVKELKQFKADIQSIMMD